MGGTTDSEPLMSCSACGASIYREHIERHMAGLLGGAMYCPHCYQARQQAEAAAASGQDLATLALSDVPPAGDRSGRSSITGIAAFTDASTFEAQVFQRPLNPAGRGASRMRIFHCKLAPGPVMHMNLQINQWLDANPDIEIKFANTTVGVMEAKHAEPNLIVTLFF